MFLYAENLKSNQKSDKVGYMASRTSVLGLVLLVVGVIIVTLSYVAEETFSFIFHLVGIILIVVAFFLMVLVEVFKKRKG